MEDNNERVTKAALILAIRMANLIVSGTYSSEIKVLASGILGLLRQSDGGELKTGRVFAGDLVIGGLYIAHGWPDGKFEWTFLGVIRGDSARISIKHKDSQPSVELLGDHGLAPYSIESQERFWHPTNWTEGTGITESTGRKVMDTIIAKIAANSGTFELQEEDDEFP